MCALNRVFFFFFNDTATTEIYTLSLHDALPISLVGMQPTRRHVPPSSCSCSMQTVLDRKSTRLNSSHDQISYAVFCLKKKKKHHKNQLLVTSYNSPVHRDAHHD